MTPPPQNILRIAGMEHTVYGKAIRRIKDDRVRPSGQTIYAVDLVLNAPCRIQPSPQLNMVFALRVPVVY